MIQSLASPHEKAGMRVSICKIAIYALKPHWETKGQEEAERI
jgi:hypothetical protein